MANFEAVKAIYGMFEADFFKKFSENLIALGGGGGCPPSPLLYTVWPEIVPPICWQFQKYFNFYKKNTEKSLVHQSSQVHAILEPCFFYNYRFCNPFPNFWILLCCMSV